MMRSQFGAACVALFVAASAAGPASAQKGGKKGDGVPGTQWEYKATQGGKVIEEGKFRAEDYKLFHSGVQIGTYSKVGNGQFKLDITRGKLKGEITMKLTKAKPHEVYNGEWEMAEGGKAHIRIEFVK